MRILPLALLVGAALLSACQSAQPQLAEKPSSAAPVPLIGLPDTLVGEYRVAGVDGKMISGGIALSISETAIGFQPRCAGFSWTYSYANGVLSTDRPEKTRAEDGPYTAVVPRPVCRIGVSPDQRRLANALDAVTEVSVAPSRAIELRGEGHSIVLYTQ